MDNIICSTVLLHLFSVKKRVDGDDINKGVKGKHRRSRSSEVGVPSESAVTDVCRAYVTVFTILILVL